MVNSRQVIIMYSLLVLQGSDYAFRSESIRWKNIYLKSVAHNSNSNIEHMTKVVSSVQHNWFANTSCVLICPKSICSSAPFLRVFLLQPSLPPTQSHKRLSNFGCGAATIQPPASSVIIEFSSRMFLSWAEIEQMSPSHCAIICVDRWCVKSISTHPHISAWEQPKFRYHGQVGRSILQKRRNVFIFFISSFGKWWIFLNYSTTMGGKKSTWASQTQVSRVLKDILEAHSWIRAIG